MSSPSSAEPIIEPSPAPPVLFWYKLTMTATAVMYGLLVPAGIGMTVMAEQLDDEEMSPSEWRIMGLLICLIAGPLLVTYLLPLFLKPSKGSWIFGLVLMALLMSSCCYWPVCIPLIIHWVREDTRAYFGA